jgi:hypothetical protein
VLLSLSAFCFYTIARDAAVASVDEIPVLLALVSFEPDHQAATGSFHTSFLITLADSRTLFRFS